MTNKLQYLIGVELLRSKFKRSTRKLTFMLASSENVINDRNNKENSVYKVDIAKIMNVDINDEVKMCRHFQFRPK